MAGSEHADAILTPHAVSQMRRRGITEQAVRALLASPGQVLEVRPGRIVLQSRLGVGATSRLLRVFVDVDRVPEEVVTVYLTSRVARYWSQDENDL